jgi:hypothetical protein
MFIGFVIATLVSNTFIRTIGIVLMPINAWFGVEGFLFYFSYFCDDQLKEAGFKLSVFLGAAGILTVALGFASQTSAIT